MRGRVAIGLMIVVAVVVVLVRQAATDNNDDGPAFDYCVHSITGQTVDCSDPNSATPPSTAGTPVNCVVKKPPSSPDYCSGILEGGTPCAPVKASEPGPCRLLVDLRRDYEKEHGPTRASFTHDQSD